MLLGGCSSWWLYMRRLVVVYDAQAGQQSQGSVVACSTSLFCHQGQQGETVVTLKLGGQPTKQPLPVARRGCATSCAGRPVAPAILTAPGLVCCQLEPSELCQCCMTADARQIALLCCSSHVSLLARHPAAGRVVACMQCSSCVGGYPDTWLCMPARVAVMHCTLCGPGCQWAVVVSSRGICRQVVMCCCCSTDRLLQHRHGYSSRLVPCVCEDTR